MLDIKRIRENLDDIKKAMERRGEREFDLDAVVELDNKRREILQEVEVMKNELNTASKNIPNLIIYYLYLNYNHITFSILILKTHHYSPSNTIFIHINYYIIYVVIISLQKI